MKSIFYTFLTFLFLGCSCDVDPYALPLEISGEWRFVRLFDNSQSSRCWECPDFIHEMADPVIKISIPDSNSFSMKIENQLVKGLVNGNTKKNTSTNTSGEIKFELVERLNPIHSDIKELLSSNGQIFIEELLKVKSYNLAHHAKTNKLSFIELFSNQYVLILAKEDK